MEIDSQVTHSDWKAVVSDPTLHQILDHFLAAPAMDMIEYELRQEALQRSQQQDPPDSFVQYWKQILRAIYYIIQNSEEGKPLSSPADTTAKNLTTLTPFLRRLPITILEDILDISSLADGYKVWNSTIVDDSSFFFSDLLWSATSSSKQQSPQNPSWLPFLKMTNRFVRKLQQQPDEIVGKEITAAMAACEILQLLSRVYSISEKSATRVFGSHNEDHMSVVESEMEYTKQLNNNMRGSGHTETSSTDYSLYHMFWKLQHDLRNPNAINVLDFLKRLKTVFHALQSHPIVDVPTTRNTWIQQSRPYLTQGRLLAIQLTDQNLRDMLLTQFIIVARHLMSQVPRLQQQLQPHLETAKSLMSKNLLEFTEKSALLNVSESQWRNWKQKKCQLDIEKPQHPSDQIGKPNGNASRKRKRAGMRDKDEVPLDWNTEHLQDISKKMHASVPSPRDYIEDYVEALDPDAGIEAEYHPRNNALYTWRALRLMARDHLEGFTEIHPSGDFELMVRNLYKTEHGLDIPGQKPLAYEELESSSEEENEDKDIIEEVEEQDENKESEAEVKDSERPLEVDNGESQQAASTENGPKNENVEGKAPSAKDDSLEIDSSAFVEEKGNDEKKDDLKKSPDNDVQRKQETNNEHVHDKNGARQNGTLSQEEIKERKEEMPSRSNRSLSPPRPNDSLQRRSDVSRDFSSRSRQANGQQQESRRSFDGRGGQDRRDDRDWKGRNLQGARRVVDDRDRRSDDHRREEWRAGDRVGDRRGERDDRGGGRGGRRGTSHHRH
jgi:THO complex subunit 1